MEIISWSGGADVKFGLLENELRGLEGLNLSAEAKTESKTSGGEEFTSLKSKGGYKLALTGVLNAVLGVDVKQVSMSIMECARQGKKGYLYMNGAKLLPPRFMLVSAKTSDIAISPGGQWTAAKVAMNFEQCTKYDGQTTTNKPTGGADKGDGDLLASMLQEDITQHVGEDLLTIAFQEMTALDLARFRSDDVDRWYTLGIIAQQRLTSRPAAKLTQPEPKEKQTGYAGWANAGVERVGFANLSENGL